ncbi:MAG: Ca-activated chloride channel family protein [Bradymonadia bacterium]
MGWLEAAGLSARELTAAGLAEAGRQLGLMRAMAIHDQPADAFAPDVLIGLTRWVSAGGVLVLAGRDDAFGPGGWGGTALDTLSPLASDPRPPKARRLAVSLALDRSGSMAEEAGGIGAKAVGQLGAAIAAGLADDDRLGVLAFGMQAEPLLALTAVGRLRAAGIRTPTLARGGTALIPMARAAVAQLAVAEAPRKVLVVLTDGQLTDADQADAAITMLRAKGVRLVAILTGEDPSMQPLQRIAQATGGVAIRADRAAISRRALAGVLAVGSDGLFARGGPVQARGAWAARVGGAPAPVGRRVRVRARPNARVLATVDGDPLLAEWAIGQGRVIALASDRWDLAADQWAALLSPAAAERPAEARIRVEEGLLVYEADPRDPPPAGAAIIQGATRSAVAWRPVGPGRAVAPLPPGPVEVLTVTSPTANGAVIARVTRPPSVEIQRTGLDLGALTLQARLTGGQIVAPDQVAGVVAELRGRQKTDPAAPWLLALAALLALVEVARWAGIPMRSRRKSPMLGT